MAKRGGNTKLILGGGAVAALLYLGMQMRGPGAGGDAAGNAPAVATTEQPAEEMTPGEEPDLELPEQSEPGMSAEEDIDLVDDLAKVKPPEMIAVQVREGAYLVAAPGRDIEEMTLDGVVAEAKRTTGSEAGIRVQIEYHDSARVADEERLLAALAEAEIANEAIQKKDEYIGAGESL